MPSTSSLQNWFFDEWGFIRPNSLGTSGGHKYHNDCDCTIEEIETHLEDEEAIRQEPDESV